jgi:phospholipase C
MQENRAFDHVFGWRAGVNGLTGGEFNFVDPRNTSSEKIYVNNKFPYISLCDPLHGTPSTTTKIYSGVDENKVPDNGGFVMAETGRGGVM